MELNPEAKESLEGIFEALDNVGDNANYLYVSGTLGTTPFVVFIGRNDIVDKALPVLDELTDHV